MGVIRGKRTDNKLRVDIHECNFIYDLFFYTACGLGSYKAANESGECQLCPSNSRTSSEGASNCDCEEGYARLQNDPPHLGCTSV